ncbi:hypothetical protein LL14B4_12895 (plasmid) [Lactococcus lactis subsp. lactis]|uniref:Uncharacterized protein n=1 Tax=Lactococcus lactis subsp. lactis TaxID=1360 RepID=A0A2Z3KHV3_LACLL|nr:hypothetical protein [Lactococcus lactis]AWN67097.1 hypothetical protein LL14B4_12895 [Lactococcus lactis subsp. lactis]
MKTEVVCKECKEVHHLPTYDNICQYCQQGKPNDEMSETKGHVPNVWSAKENNGECKDGY